MTNWMMKWRQGGLDEVDKMSGLRGGCEGEGVGGKGAGSGTNEY